MVNYMALGNASFQGTQAGLELYNAYRLNQKLKGMDDKYVIPSEIGQNLDQANARALAGLPEAFQNNYKQQLATNSAYNLSGAGDLKSGTIGVANANNMLNQGDMNLLAMNSQAQDKNQQVLYGMRNQMADYKDMAWSHNVDMPYKDTQQLMRNNFYGAGRDASKASNAAAGSSIGDNGASKNMGTTASYDGGYSGNPYGQNTGTWQNPDTSNMFRQSQRSGANSYF